MSTGLQKVIVYELFAIFLAVVICAVSLAETFTAGYLTGPWIFLGVPAVIALLGVLKALGASSETEAGDGTDGSAERNDTPSDSDAGDDTEKTEGDQAVVGMAGDPPY